MIDDPTQDQEKEPTAVESDQVSETATGTETAEIVSESDEVVAEPAETMTQTETTEAVVEEKPEEVVVSPIGGATAEEVKE